MAIPYQDCNCLGSQAILLNILLKREGPNFITKEGMIAERQFLHIYWWMWIMNLHTASCVAIFLSIKALSVLNEKHALVHCWVEWTVKCINSFKLFAHHMLPVSNFESVIWGKVRFYLLQEGESGKQVMHVWSSCSLKSVCCFYTEIWMLLKAAW